MSMDQQDLINKILLAQAQNKQNQPSFMGLSAPQDPNALNPLLAQLRNQQYVNSVGNTPGEYGYLHDAGQKDFARAGQALAGILGIGQPPPQQQQTQQQGPAFTMPPPATDASGNPAQNMAIAAPAPNPGSTPQQSVNNMVLAAKAFYSSQIQRGIDPDQAKVSTAQALVSWGAPGADEILDKANDQLLKNSQTRAATKKDTSQANMDSANIDNQKDEAKNRAFTQGSGTWQTTFKDPNGLYMLQTNANGETKRVELAPPPNAANAPFDPNTVASIVQAIKDGRMKPVDPSGTFAKSAIGQAVLAAQSADTSIDATSYPTKAKALVAFATGPEGKAVTSFNVAQSHLDTLQQAAAALDNGSIPLANKALNALGVQGGATAPAAFAATKNVVANEIVKTIVPGQSAEADRQEVQNEITAAQTPAQLQAVISKYQELMSGKLAGLRQQYETSTGMKNFEGKLSKRAIELAHQSPAYTSQFPNPTQPGSGSGAVTPTQQAPLPATNAAGWTLHSDAKGNRAYVSPDGSKFQQVQ
jgi:hypothetical protein